MAKSNQKNKKTEEQVNMGYENTKKRNDEDNRELDRLDTTDTGNDEGPVENKDDSAGLRSESGSKSTGGESGNTERGRGKSESGKVKGEK